MKYNQLLKLIDDEIDKIVKKPLTEPIPVRKPDAHLYEPVLRDEFEIDEIIFNKKEENKWKATHRR